MNPLISVIMPVYNAEKYLFEALESIRMQTLSNYECIVINDGSKDKSLEIINQFILKDKRFILINQKNMGVGKALNAGIAIAKGKYTARMDSDDISHPTRFKKQFDFLENYSEKNIILGTNYYIIDEKNNKIKKSHRFFSEVINKSNLLLARVPVAHPTIMARTELFTKYNYSDTKAEDLELWIRLIDHVKFVNLKERLLNYRSHDSQVTKTKDFKSYTMSEGLEMTLSLYSKFNISFQKKQLAHLIYFKDKKIKLNSLALGLNPLIQTFKELNTKSNLSERGVFILLYIRNISLTQRLNKSKTFMLVAHVSIKSFKFIFSKHPMDK